MKISFKEFKPKSICVVDNIGGTYFNIAVELTRYFKVYYHSVNQNPFPMVSLSNIGYGYEDITVITDFWSNINTFDIICFPDIYFNSWGTYLRSVGKKVWGGCVSEKLELDRKLFKDELKSSGMSIAPTKYVMGIDNLTKYLKSEKDKWIKISFFRGNMETFHHIDINQSMIWLQALTISMGPLGKTIEFMIEDSISSIAEVGYDGFAVNGLLPDNQIWGVETKDSSWVGTHTLSNQMPYPVIDINNKFKNVLTRYNHTGFYSNEIRVGEDGINYYTDICARGGVPPSNAYMSLITNWDEIIINGCDNILVEPKYNSKYCVELILKSTYCHQNFMPISIPDEYRNSLKLKGCLNVDGKDYIIPFEQAGIKDNDAFGSVVVVGDSIDDILTNAVEIAGSIECYGLNYDKDALNRSKKSIDDITNKFKISF